MKKTLAAVFVAALAFANPAQAAHKELHVGSHGQRVANLQWLLSGHDPSHYRSIKPYHGRIDGRYGKSTANAVWNMKFQLGYPMKYVNKTANDGLFQYLKGQRKRSLTMIAVGAHRLGQIKHRVNKVAACQRNIVRIARSQIGVTEYPYGYNTGRQVRVYQRVTGAYYAPWCASFAQWVITSAGHGPIADRSAGVFYIRSWAYTHGMLRSRPEPGTLVLYLWSSGHMGVVVKVGQYGFWAVEGNASNAVRLVYRPYNRSPIAFVYLPGCS